MSAVRHEGAGFVSSGRGGARRRARHPQWHVPGELGTTLSDHAFGLELELAELTEQRERARVQGREDDKAKLQRAMDAVQLELAQATAQLTGASPIPTVHLTDQARSA